MALHSWFACFLFLYASSAFAAFGFSSATLNGGVTTRVAPGTSISTSLTLDYFGNTNGANGQWGATLWSVDGVSTCHEHADHSAPGPDSITFTITAPASTGQYDVSFVAFSSDNCGGQVSATFTLAGGIRVQATTLLAEYRLEEDAWTGASGEVKDSSGNNRHGTAFGVPLPGMDTSSPARGGNPGTCDYGVFGGNALSLSGLPVDTSPGAKTSVAFWMYWDGGNNVMPIGWNVHDLWLVSGVFGFNTGNSDVFGISSSGLANGWHHVVAVFTNGAVASNELYIDGVKQTLTQRLSSPNNGNAYVRSTLQVSGWGANSGYRFSGHIDDVKVYNGALSQAEVNAAYTATHTCPIHPPPAAANLVAEYRFDSAWSATVPLADSTGNGRDAPLTGGGVDQVLAPASGLKPETCKAGSFSRSGYFTASGLNLNTASGAKSTVAFWMYWDGAYPSDGWAMPFRWDNQFYDLAFRSDGWFGFNTGQGDVTGFSSNGLANGWHHVVAVFTSGGVGGNKIYIDGQLRGLQSSGSPAARATSTGAVIGAGGNWSNGYKFGGRIDNLHIYRDELSQTDVTTLYQQAQPCGSLVAEYRMDEPSWNGTAGEIIDSVGTNNGQAISGAVISTGKLCNGASFAPANSYALVNHTSAIEVGKSGGDFSVAYWMRHTNTFTGAWRSLIHKGAANTDRTFAMWMYPSSNQMHARVSTTSNWNEGINASVAPIALNAWTHVTYVKSGSSLRLYLNGTLDSQVTLAGTSIANTGPLYLGKDPWYPGFGGQLDEFKIFASALSAADITSGYANESSGKNWDGSARTCASPPSTGPAALNAVDVGANAVSGRITTKTAGTSFNLDVFALNAARTAQDGGASGEVLVDLLANSGAGVTLDANNCPITATTLAVGTVTLTAGKATATMGALANSWRDVRVRMRYPATGAATVTACSADNFAVKPAALSAIASHADWQTAGTSATLANAGTSGGEVHKAGRSFSVRVSGYNAANVLTGNYDGSPSATTACVLPASGCVMGTFSTGAFSAGGGTVSSSTASYSEVGAIAATFVDTGYAGVDSGDSAASCAGFHVCAGAITIGRFVPDHFDIAVNTPTFTPGCGGFSYLGQPFGFGTPPRWTVTARNSAGATTRNYSGALFKINAATVTGQSWSAAGGTLTAVAALPAASVTDLGGGLGSITFGVGDPAAGAGLAFTRAAPVAPFDASLTLAASVADSEGVVHAGNPYQQVGIGFDDGNVGTTNDAQMRFGRLRLANAVGSELLPLPLPLTAQFWNGQGWVGNAEDHCTTISSPNLTFFSQTADNQLASGETTASFNATLVAGNGNLRFTAPGQGNSGFMDLSVAAPAWLKFNWDGVDQSGDGDLLDDNPRARAAFGKRRGSDKIIIRREIY